MQEYEVANYHDDVEMEQIALIGNQQQQNIQIQHPVGEWRQQQQQPHPQKQATNVILQNDKSRIAPLPFFYTEDMRISRILRRLSAETNPVAALEICEKLETAVRAPSNAAYILRSLEMLLDNLVQILKQCPLECVQKVSNILGIIGYVGHANFHIFKNFISKTYQNSKSLQKYLMLALKSTLRCDAVNLNLLVYSERMLELLIEYLENAEKADIFIVISDTIVEFSKNYKRAFSEHFTDIVDIVVGWHLETDQPQSLKFHCALVLQKWAAYFLNELDFTYGLLGQFLEDITAWCEDLTSQSATRKAKIKAEQRIAAFFGAFTTILKSLSTPTEFIAISADRNFVENAVIIISKAAKEAFSLALVGEEIVYNVNDFLSLLLTYNYKFTNIKIVEEIIALEIQHLGTFNAQQIETFLYTTLCLLRYQRTSLSIGIITLLLGIVNNPLNMLKLSHNELVHKLLLKIYHEILMLKNVPLLQEAYKHIKSNIHNIIQIMVNVYENNDATTGAFCCAVQKLNFYFNALSVLATQTSSIISIYALDPSILELLLHNCKASNAHLWSIEPSLHYALLQLLSVHCQKNRNFITTSRLLNDQTYASQVMEEQSRNSPTSEHFAHILQFFASILENAEYITLKNLDLLLSWLHQLIVECSEHMPVLLRNQQFLKICKYLCATSNISPIKSVKCMRELFTNSIPTELQASFRDTAIYHLNSPVDDVSKSFASILGLLPLSISLSASSLSDEYAQQLSKMYELEKWYRGTTHYVPLRVKYFKKFLNYLDINSAENQAAKTEIQNISKGTSQLDNIFSRCFINQSGHEKLAHYQSIARHQRLLILSWMQCETARYCVQNKLRTTVGKPQETFLAIEAIIMKYARMLALKETKDEQFHNILPLDSALDLQHKARILLGFLESLEKHIYNAAEGTAFAMPSPEKPAKTFFRINASTCKEWFKRIRSAVCLIAGHCMEPEMVIRYSEQTLAKPESINSALLEHTLIGLAGAYLQRNEGDSLHGLNVWLRTHMGKNFVWIQYAAEQGNGHLEQAATGYKSLLEENHMRLDGPIKQFILEQLTHCLYYTGQWKEIKKIVKQYSENNEVRLAHMYNNAHLDTMHALCYGNENKMDNPENEINIAFSDALLQLMDWSTCDQIASDLTTKQRTSSVMTYSSQLILRNLEDFCIVQTLKSDDTHRLPDDKVCAIQAGLRESFGRGCLVDERKIAQSNEYIFLNHVIQKVTVKEDFHSSLKFVNRNFDDDSTILMKYLLWTLLLEQRAHASGNYMSALEKVTSKLRLYLDMATISRQDGNYNYCRRVLKRFFVLKGLNDSLEEISLRLRNNEKDIDIFDDNLLRGISELSKCIYNTTTNPTQIQQNQYEAINLSSALCLKIVESINKAGENTPCPEIGAKTLLNLSEWLGQRNVGNNSNNYNMNLNNLPQLQELLKQLPETSVQLSNDELNINMPAVDKAIGRLINASINQRNDAGDAWLAYGNWCYRWGKKLVELKNADSSVSILTQISDQCLSERDLKDIKSTLKGNVSDEVILQVADILKRHQLGKTDIVDDELESNDIGSVESIQQELRGLKTLADISEEELIGIISIWRRTHKTVYAYYETAIRAYLKYLSIETSEPNKSTSNKNGVEDSGFVTTTLRLLRLVVKHAFALQDVLEEGLNTTPLRPWRVIIPQLFSRLNHHEPYVRNSLAQLLCRLAQQEPHAVIFPAVVGSQEEGSNNFTTSHEMSSSAINSIAPHEISSSSTNAIALSNCFSSLVSSLANQAPETVRHVQLLVKELRRVALLWEEYWLHTLGRLLTEYSSIFSGLVIETRKCNKTNVQQLQKLKAKHELLLQYVIADVKKIALVTDKTAETKYEQSFKDHYQQYIQQTLQELSQPEILIAGPIESWQKLKNLYQRFQQRSMHGSIAAAATLKISELSPILAKMHDTSISMPGIERSHGDTVFIKSIESSVHVLPTKTRPKKLVFLGSDGRKYTYLFKGLEDLHLDERIMQFLSITNLMMERTPYRRLQSESFRAHYYSVIPLGSQSGLISWVDGVTPLFAVYKKWQQRDASLKQQQSKERPNAEHQNLAQLNDDSASSQLTALRPSELFYKKLRPLLTAQNIKLKDPRKHWPLSILRRVLDELTEETPNDLLSKELWCHATSAAEWKKTVRNYSTSMAVMSVIGYIIGLGDRHLDNVLINLVTGEIVHIDYNVCFEKGKTLRVPEKVPFRMTPNLENALGVTGVEGTYRLGCEYVLRTLRKEKETLLTLLEAFVYDPLVDWTVSDDGVSGGTTRASLAYTAMQSVTTLKPGTTTTNVANVLSRESPLRVSKQYEIAQRRQEWELMQQTIKSRFEDIKSHWSEYIYEIQNQLSKISTTSHDLSNNLKVIRKTEEERNKLNQQVSMIRELEMLGTAICSHSLNTITQRFQAYKNDEDALETLRKSAQVAHNDIETLLNTYFEHIIGGDKNKKELIDLQSEIFQQENTVYIDEFELVANYIKKISDKIYEDVNFARKEMDNSLQQESRAAMECIRCLDQYARIMDYYPRTKLKERNALFRYADWYRQLWNDETDLKMLKIEVEKCRNKVLIDADTDKSNVMQYAKLMEKTSYEMNMDLHQAMIKEVNLQQQQIHTVESIITEIKDFAFLDNNTCSTLQGAMLIVLTETLIQLEQNENSPNVFKEIDFIENIDFVFQHLQLTPKSLQQLSEQKLLKALRNVLQALHDFEQDSIFERTVQLFFLDDDKELQDYLLKLCEGEMSLQQPDPDKNNALKPLHSLLSLLQNHFDMVEMQLQQLKHVIKEILEIEACSWYNILLERLSIIHNLSNGELTEWKKESIMNLFNVAHDQVSSLKSDCVEMVYDVCQLSIPIRNYVKTIHAKYLHGVTIALIEAYISSFQTNIEYVECNAAARMLCNKLVKAIQHNFELKECRLQIRERTQFLDHYTRVASAYIWANQSTLDDSSSSLAHIIAKDKLLSSIGNANQSMSAWKHTIIKIQDEICQHTELVQQRLRWITSDHADCNSDSAAIKEIISQFEECSAAQTARYNFFLQLAVKLIDYASVLLQFETLMDDSITGINTQHKAEDAFCVLIDDWQQVRIRYAQSSAGITPAEKSIVQLLDPQDKIDACWISNITGLLDEMIFSVQRNLINFEEERKTIHDRLYLHASELQNIIDNPLRTDMRQLLRLIIKNAKYPVRSGGNSPNLADEACLTNLAREVLQLLKTLTGKLGDLKTKLCVREDYSDETLAQLNEKLKEVHDAINQHCQELNNLVQHYVEQSHISLQRSNSASPAHVASPNTDRRDNENATGAKDALSIIEKKGEQKRNVYAVSVWKRIRMKLEGRDPDSNRRSSISEQVDFIINEATNRDNLAVLYEGWTPWV